MHNLYSIKEFNSWLQSAKTYRKIKYIQLHHTWSPGYKDFTGKNHQSLLTGMRNAHLQRGFIDIAQNITIFPDGKIAVCRNFNQEPAGIFGHNKYALCIECVGCFDDKKDIMTDPQKQAIVECVTALCKHFEIAPSVDPGKETIYYHHWFDLKTGKRTNGAGNVKTCPGDNFFGGNSVEACEKYFIPEVLKCGAKC